MSSVVGFRSGTVVGPVGETFASRGNVKGRIWSLGSACVHVFCGNSVFNTPDLDLIFAEESGHARFELFPSSRSISLCDVVVLPDLGACSRSFHLQSVRERPACLRQKVWIALLSVPRVLADAELLWTKVQR